MSETVLLLIILAESLALIGVSGLWLRQRRRAAGLAQQMTAGRDSKWASSGRATVKAVLETAARVREKGVGGALRSSIEELAGWAEVEQPDLQRLAARDGTVTIFFSDIEDSTALNEGLGDRDWLRVLSGHDKIVRGGVETHNGHIIKSQGDGFMIAFASPDEAMRCAVEVQRALAAGDRRLRDTPIRVRIGIHTGAAVQKDGDLFGRNVALAARVAGLADGGEILVTPQVSEAVEDGDEFVFTGARDVELKGLPGSYRLLAVAWEE
ncbi:MAG: adenylate/guanylate cyclase domain-containing protein [Acidimicrobiales bacterium]